MTDNHNPLPDISAAFESKMLLDERDVWKQRALQAEQMVQMLQSDRPFDPQMTALQMANHVNERAVHQAESYRKALLYVRDITGVIASNSEPSADLPNVMRRLNTNVSLTLSRFGEDGLTKTS